MNTIPNAPGLKVLFDENIVLDIALRDRSLDFPDSLKVYTWLSENIAHIYIAAASTPTIDYLLSTAMKKLKNKGKETPDN